MWLREFVLRKDTRVSIITGVEVSFQPNRCDDVLQSYWLVILHLCELRHRYVDIVGFLFQNHDSLCLLHSHINTLIKFKWSMNTSIAHAAVYFIIQSY